MSCPNESDEAVVEGQCLAAVRTRSGKDCVYRQCKNKRQDQKLFCTIHTGFQEAGKLVKMYDGQGKYKVQEVTFSSYLTDVNKATTASLDAITKLSSGIDEQVQAIVANFKVALGSLGTRLQTATTEISTLKGAERKVVEELQAKSSALESKEETLKKQVEELGVDRENSVAVISDLEEQIQALNMSTVDLETRLRLVVTESKQSN